MLVAIYYSGHFYTQMSALCIRKQKMLHLNRRLLWIDFFVSRILALMDPLKHAAAFTSSAWAQTQAKLLPDGDVCQHQGFTSELVCLWQMETWLCPFSSFWFNWESFYLFCGIIMKGFWGFLEVHVGKSLWRLEATVLHCM